MTHKNPDNMDQHFLFKATHTIAVGRLQTTHYTTMPQERLRMRVGGVTVKQTNMIEGDYIDRGTTLVAQDETLLNKEDGVVLLLLWCSWWLFLLMA